MSKNRMKTKTKKNKSSSKAANDTKAVDEFFEELKGFINEDSDSNNNNNEQEDDTDRELDIDHLEFPPPNNDFSQEETDERLNNLIHDYVFRDSEQDDKQLEIQITDQELEELKGELAEFETFFADKEANEIKIRDAYMAEIHKKTVKNKKGGLNLTSRNFKHKMFTSYNLVEPGQAEKRCTLFVNASFIKANLFNVDFTGNNLNGATFKQATMDNAKLNHTVCKKSSFIDASLKSAEFINVDLTQANLTRIIVNEHTTFKGAQFFVGMNHKAIITAAETLSYQLTTKSNDKKAAKKYAQEAIRLRLNVLQGPILTSLFQAISQFPKKDKRAVLEYIKDVKLFKLKPKSNSRSPKLFHKKESSAIQKIADKLKKVENFKKIKP